MKTAAIRTLKKKLARNEPVYGLWVTLESPSITEMGVALGLDWVVVDAEHGHLDWKDILEHIRATVRSETVVLVRIAELNRALIKRALDIGADGLLIPWLETEEQLKEALKASKFPIEGVRGIGVERATGWGECLGEHALEANDHVLVVPIIETVRAGRSIRDLCAVPGIDLFFLGPADYTATAGFRGQWEGPGVATELLAIKDVIRASGKACGVVATSVENLLERQRQGFQLLGLGVDSSILLRGLHTAMASVGRERRIRSDLTPEPKVTNAVLVTPPESFRPDRRELISYPGQRPLVELAPGVQLDCLVGQHNAARNLTTGLVTFAAGAQLPCHTHSVSESITVLTGELWVSVEGREYVLGVLDNIAIPGGVAHSARNGLGSEVVRLHSALASEAPGREFVSRQFEHRAMAATSEGVRGKERVTRFRSAHRSGAGPGTSFIDYFNEELMPGLEMSGGYGLFHPGGRLPAHFHDFDESICIFSGTATCLVEGRRYQMAGGSTALQPRGRMHYFINEREQPMEMIWVYAGPSPERLVVEEKLAAEECNPWGE